MSSGVEILGLATSTKRTTTPKRIWMATGRISISSGTSRRNVSIGRRPFIGPRSSLENIPLLLDNDVK
ncbi:hypothetical protein CC1G_15358 [Coprinopsis cinerea okayama7|uniref:Uncharacterized protein n=1 Tax=Coprinopsis cinerea (strain Okayama-7 / 130 / ATCC MYA-4618 / FGSC 9003) TaxID=240176 RepID=D6RQ37_COPC7|nr:hypothetical protein CC1G_15358 [Coprinopsis cinerea okayama7\|eukprot:XP_002910451.1 hypothetical protein CC1G_15358 [Coprinopsis cinerea okayama7\